MVKVSIIEDSDLGGQLNPVSNNNELRKTITGRKNCYIYTKGTFSVDNDILIELKVKNITLVGLAYATLQQTLIEEGSKIIQNQLLYGKIKYSFKDIEDKLKQRGFIDGNIR